MSSFVPLTLTPYCVQRTFSGVLAESAADIDEAVMINSVSIADYTFGAAGETATTTDEEGNQVSVTVGGGENGESDVQFVISIYSVYTMTKPNTDMPE